MVLRAAKVPRNVPAKGVRLRATSLSKDKDNGFKGQDVSVRAASLKVVSRGMVSHDSEGSEV